jgi:hypothetical protein
VQPRSNKRIIIGVTALIALIAIAIFLFFSSTPAKRTSTTTQQSGPILVPAGKPNNAGDNAKSSVSTTPPAPISASGGSTQTTTQSSSPAAASSAIAVSDFSITPQGDSSGTIRIADTVSGVTEASCSLVLTSPSGQVRTVNGTLLYSGSAYFCSFGSVAGITEKGTWSGRITASASK